MAKVFDGNEVELTWTYPIHNCGNLF